MGAAEKLLFQAPEAATVGVDAEYVAYPALPIVSRPFNGWLCARALAPAVARWRPDVLLAYWLYPDAYGAMLVARRAGLPLVAGARGSDIRVRDRVSKHLTRRVVRAADRLLVVSEDLGRLAIADYGADPARVRVIANGCDAATFHLADRGAARAALGIGAEAELVLYVGRLVAEKGLRELIAAARRLRATRPRLQLALVGSGPLHGEFAAEIARDTSLTVHLPGAQAPELVARWMSAATWSRYRAIRKAIRTCGRSARLRTPDRRHAGRRHSGNRRRQLRCAGRAARCRGAGCRPRSGARPRLGRRGIVAALLARLAPRRRRYACRVHGSARRAQRCMNLHSATSETTPC